MLFDHVTINLFKKAVKRDGFIKLPAHGNSMFPLIKKEDLCQFEFCRPSEIRKGDIILFHSRSGQLVAHRFYHKKKIDGNTHYFFKGDSNLGFDRPVTGERLIGKLSEIEKRDTTLSTADLKFVIWGKLIVTFPLLSGFIRKYLNRKQTILHKIKKVNF